MIGNILAFCYQIIDAYEITPVLPPTVSFS